MPVVLIISPVGIFGFIEKGIWAIRWPNGRVKRKKKKNTQTPATNIPF